jgi:hypothetical protein
MSPAPVRIRPPDPRRRAGPTRRYLHSLVAGAGWAAFVWSWIAVLGRARGSEVTFTLAFLALSLTIIVSVTALWVTHNVSLARRKHSRVAVRERVTPISTLSEPGVVHVSLEGERKVYRAGDAARVAEAEKEAA